MYKGFVISESLKNPTVLNDLVHLDVNVEYQPEDEITIWHTFKVKVSDHELTYVTQRVSKEIKPTWYAHFWNKQEVVVVLPGKTCRFSRSGSDMAEDFLQCKQAALDSGVEEKYLDFLLEE